MKFVGLGEGFSLTQKSKVTVAFLTDKNLNLGMHSINLISGLLILPLRLERHESQRTMREDWGEEVRGRLGGEGGREGKNKKA